MLKNTDIKYEVVRKRLRALKTAAKALALDIQSEFGEIRGSYKDVDLRVLNGKFEMRDDESTEDTWCEIEDKNLSLHFLGAILDNTAANLGLWSNP